MSFDELIQKGEIVSSEAVQIRNNLDYVLSVLENRAEYWRSQQDRQARAVAYDTALMMVMYAITNQTEQLHQFEKY